MALEEGFLYGLYVFNSRSPPFSNSLVSASLSGGKVPTKDND